MFDNINNSYICQIDYIENEFHPFNKYSIGNFIESDGSILTTIKLSLLNN